MDEHERIELISTENHFVVSDDIGNAAAGELTATPLKRYVTFLGNRKDGSASKWICNFGCKKEPYKGTYSRIRAHLIGLLSGQKVQGVALCSKVNKEEREKMKIEEAEAKRVFRGGSRLPITVVPTILPLGKFNTTMKMENQSVMCIIEANSQNGLDVDAVIATFFYANGIPINLAQSPFWYDK
ncbi:hypothetical protein IFM89_002549 [Coptis chinensis]|uniref:Uncharacterized protein n=1 Tax=Coptis chinensis TaxID=261450 RepID=A0A835HI39_9MAGN|nr:hypothetical protein IFM89_002549 [Coptis chinensis]